MLVGYLGLLFDLNLRVWVWVVCLVVWVLCFFGCIAVGRFAGFVIVCVLISGIIVRGCSQFRFGGAVFRRACLVLFVSCLFSLVSC